ncbi:MAG: TatD family hydrolase [Gammaproteobacteria bacterium]|nr:TatD family hydrolase [Gammaproteobacteria bacterium]
MTKSIPLCCIQCIGCVLASLFASTLVAEPLFDTHLHYNARDAEHLSPRQIITVLDRNSIQYALVTGIPARLALELQQQAPARILPLLGVYRSAEDKETWVRDAGLPPRIEAQLKQGSWRGIGELHLFARDRHSPVFTRIIQLAQHYRLPLLLHADPAVIDTVYEKAPGHPVIWAHAGTFPYPDLIADYLARYPALRVDLSVRDQRIAPDGILRDDWYELFVRYPDRFMVGVDTYSLSRWHSFDQAVANIRGWLRQLPADVAMRLAYDNAAALFEAFRKDSRAKVSVRP